MDVCTFVNPVWGNSDDIYMSSEKLNSSEMCLVDMIKYQYDNYVNAQ